MRQVVYYKMRQFYYKLLQLLQIVTFITKCVGATSEYNIIWVKVFNNRPSEICGRQPTKADHIISNFLKAVFNKF